MNRNHYVLTFLVALAAGLVGGGISRGALAATSVFAQTPLPPQFAPKMLRAHAFEIIDSEGRVRGVFGVGTNGVPAIRLYDGKGEIYWQTEKLGLRALAAPISR